MLNKDGVRELCYIVSIDTIEPITGSDNCEAAVVGGWKIMTRKNTFKTGDLAVYFEIDSKVPEKEPFMFLQSKHFKIKTQKYTFGGKGSFISQGLLMPLTDFPDLFEYDVVSGMGWLYTYKAKPHIKESKDTIVNTHDGLTELLKVKYSVAEDNKRKSNSNKYTKMVSRHQKLFRKNKLIKWLYERQWGKELLFFFLGKKSDKRSWPDWVRKTDEERVQNLPQLFPGDNTKWIVTEKIDGSSTTFTMKGRGRREQYYVCSRNVCFDTPEKNDKLFYDTNIYEEMAQKYDVKNKLRDILKEHEDWEFVTIQGETFGASVQKRTYGLQERNFNAFNLVYGTKEKPYIRMNSIDMKKLLDKYEIPSVPILNTEYKIPKTMDEMISYADGASTIDGDLREGVVLRTYDGESSFKAVSNQFLLKFKE